MKTATTIHVRLAPNDAIQAVSLIRSSMMLYPDFLSEEDHQVLVRLGAAIAAGINRQ